MKTKPKQSKRSAGEPWVWFTAMGLGVGMLMVVGILSLIFVEGMGVFWPKRVVQLEIQTSEGKTEKALGEIVLKQDKNGASESKQEIQIFQGNRQQFGQAFRFIDEDKIQKQSQPTGVILMERLEYGKGIGYPLKLVLEDQSTLAADSKQFDATLEKLIAASNARWKEIRHLEKDQIGKINYRMEKIRLKLKKLEKNSQDMAALQAEQEKLQKEYETLAAQARELRAQQDKNHLVLQLADGQEVSIPIGQILHYYYPNQLSGMERAKLFFVNLGKFVSEDPREANTEGGIFPAIFGTLVMTVLMSLAVVPFGVMGAIYLSEYAKQGVLVRLVRIAVNNLAGVPSIVFGVFGLGFFVYMVGGTIDSLFFSDQLPTPTFGTGGLMWASLTLALMTVPVVIVSTEEALASVSRGVREGALACGASKWQMIKKVILPASAPGILTGAILAMARGAGEVAPLMLVGVVKLAPTLPINSNFPYVHLDQKFMHLGFHIFDLGFQSPDSEAAKPMVFATTLFLIALVLVLNLGAILLRERLRKKYASGSF